MSTAGCRSSINATPPGTEIAIDPSSAATSSTTTLTTSRWVIPRIEWSERTGEACSSELYLLCVSNLYCIRVLFSYCSILLILCIIIIKIKSYVLLQFVLLSSRYTSGESDIQDRKLRQTETNDYRKWHEQKHTRARNVYKAVFYEDRFHSPFFTRGDLFNRRSRREREISDQEGMFIIVYIHAIPALTERHAHILTVYFQTFHSKFYCILII